MSWFDKLLLKLNVSHFDIIKTENEKDSLYLRRFHLMKHNKFLHWISNGKLEGIYLHHILRPDADRALHDHPWHFAAFILFGGYFEETPNLEICAWNDEPFWDPRLGNFGTKFKKCGLFSFRRNKAEQLHRISPIKFKETWSLFFCGPKFRVWGFQTENGWMPYKKYLALYCPEQLYSNKSNKKNKKSL